MEISLPQEIYNTSNVTIDITKNVHVFIGPNGSGKSKFMDNVNAKIGNQKVKIIQGNINRVDGINAIDEDQTKNQSFGHKETDNVVSLINANETVRNIIFYWFEKLFGKKLLKKDSQYWISENGDSYPLSVDGDGYKTFFNLIYYLVTPEFSTIVFDEPERHLHPNLQISLFNMIKKLSQDYVKQVYFITHNDNFIDLLSDNVEVFILNKKAKTAYNLTSVLNTVTNKQFTTWIHYNKHILFSSCVILLEGYSDQILLNHLISKLNNNAFGRNITFCSVAIAKENGGKTRIPEYQSIISQFFPCWALYDLDLLLDTGGELGKYITEPELTTFKTNLTNNGISNKNQLKTFYNTAGNNVVFLTDIINKLKQNHKVLLLIKGEMEDYCQTVGTSKLTAKIYDEVDHISTASLSVINQEYSDIIDIITKVDDLSSNNIEEFRNLIFKLIMKFYSESYQLETYDYSSISKDLASHLVQDPNYASDNNYRFTFRFLSDIEFIIPKESTEPQKKNEIEQKLKN